MYVCWYKFYVKHHWIKYICLECNLGFGKILSQNQFNSKSKSYLLAFWSFSTLFSRNSKNENMGIVGYLKFFQRMCRIWGDGKYKKRWTEKNSQYIKFLTCPLKFCNYHLPPSPNIWKCIIKCGFGPQCKVKPFLKYNIFSIE